MTENAQNYEIQTNSQTIQWKYERAEPQCLVVHMIDDKLELL